MPFLPEPVPLAARRLARAASRRTASRAAARRYPGLIVDISPDDEMFQARWPNSYFSIGRQGLLLTQRAIGLVGRDSPASILDLPSGHGRVLRFLRFGFPTAEVTAGEIDRGAVDYCAHTFGARPLVSRSPLSQVDISGFDLVWCGSLLTHFDEVEWQDALSSFRRAIGTNGILVFTTHGDFSAMLLDQDPLALAQCPNLGSGGYGLDAERRAEMRSRYDASGFAFGTYPDGTSDYGVSLSSQQWVEAAASRAGLRVVDLLPRGWGGHQDVVTCIASGDT